MSLGLGIGLDKGRLAGASFQGILDRYPNADVAFSLRLLNSAYAGALVRIRRSSDNAEKDFYPDASNIFSLSSEDGAGVVLSTWIASNDGFVSAWYDQSGNSDNATQATTSQQPQIISNGSLMIENSKAALRSTTSSLVFSDLSLIQNTGYLIACVYKNDSNDMPYGNNSGTSNFIWPYNASNTQLRTSGNDEIISLSNDNGSQVISILDVYTGVRELDYNLSNSTASVTKSTFVINEILDGYSGNSFNMDGTMQEFICWGINKNSDKTAIKTAINDYYSIY